MHASVSKITACRDLQRVKNHSLTINLKLDTNLGSSLGRVSEFSDEGSTFNPNLILPNLILPNLILLKGPQRDNCAQIPRESRGISFISTHVSFQSWKVPLKSIQVSRLTRQLKRRVRGLHLGSWILVALVVFVSSDFLLRIPGMIASVPTQFQHHQRASREPKVQTSHHWHPGSHDHRSCQLCAAPPNGLPVSSTSHLCKVRLEMVAAVLVLSSERGKPEHRIGLRTRAPPVQQTVSFA
jgi:hypothetical protein